MATPSKPWERVGTNFHNLPLPGSNDLVASSAVLHSSAGPNGGANPFLGNPTRYNTQMPSSLNPPPPVPPRQHGAPFRTSGFGPSMYGNNYGGLAPYSSMYGGGYGGGIGRFGGYSMYGSDPYATSDGGFIQLAEESTRPALQSIESIVHAVGSVSMMLESTYFAVNSSFRAIIGVAHHFGQIKMQFSQMLSAFAIIRSLRWLYRKVFYLLGLTELNPTVDNIWSSISREVSKSSFGESSEKRRRSNWPLIMLAALVFGTPWLVWKLFAMVAGLDNDARRKWMSGNGEHYLAVAQYDFVAENEREIQLKAGQNIRLAPKELQPKVRGWLLASVDGQRSGLVPGNYVNILGKSSAVTGLKQQGSEEPVGVTSQTTNVETADVLTNDFLQEQ